MAAPTIYEQYMLEFVNRERAKAGVPPLAFDGDLNKSADRHSRWMIKTDTFDHTGAGGSQPTDRMEAAGYSFTGSWTSGENIAWASLRSPTGYADEVQLLHANLMKSASHRANILNPGFQEIRIGFATGSFEAYTAAFVTQNFARTATDPFLTGVAFDDKDGDRFYDPGEGLRGLAVKAVSATGAVFETTTSSSGGYSLPVPAGTYTITFSGSGIATATKTATIGTANVKVDLVDPALTSAAKPAQAGSADASGSAGAGRDGTPDLLRDGDRFDFAPRADTHGRDGGAAPERDGAGTLRVASGGMAQNPDAPGAESFGSLRGAEPHRPGHRDLDVDRGDDLWHPNETGSAPLAPADLIL